MSLLKIMTLLWIPSLLACPTLNLKNLQCETAFGDSYTIDYIKLEGNLFSYKVFGFPVEVLLPEQIDHVVKSNQYCDGDKIVTVETFENMKAKSVIEYKNDNLTIKGRSIATKCDFPAGCRADKHYFHQFIEEDIVCQL